MVSPEFVYRKQPIVIVGHEVKTFCGIPFTMCSLSNLHKQELGQKHHIQDRKNTKFV